MANRFRAGGCLPVNSYEPWLVFHRRGRHGLCQLSRGVRDRLVSPRHRNSVYFRLMTRNEFLKFIECAALLAVAVPLLAQSPSSPQAQGAAPSSQAATPAPPKPQDTEIWEPVPKVVTPGANCTAPPSDAIVLFDGKNLDEWVSNRDKSPAKWIVADGVMTVNKAGGNIETKRSFKNYQLHIEWRIPENIT